MARSAAAPFASPQNPSAFSAYLGYMPSNSAAANPSVSYSNPMPRVRGPAQMPSKCSGRIITCHSSRMNLDYLNPLSFLPQPIGDSKQGQPQGSSQASAYGHHPILMPTKNGSITNGYPIQPQQ